MPARPLLDPASSRAHHSSLPHWCPTSPWPPTGCVLPPSSGRCILASTTRVSAARHSLVPALLLPFTDFSQFSGIHGTRRQTSPTQYRSEPVAAASARGCSGSLAFMGSPPLISRRTPRQLLVEVTAVEDGISCECGAPRRRQTYRSRSGQVRHSRRVALPPAHRRLLAATTTPQASTSCGDDGGGRRHQL